MTASRWWRWGPPLLLVAVLWLVGFPALRDYGVTWDEAIGDFFFGQRYWSYFTTFDPIYLDFASEPYPAGHVPDLSSSAQRDRPLYFYALGGTVGAATSALLSGRLGWLDPFDGFHAANLLLAAVLIFVWYRFLLGHFGPVVATLSPLLLFLSPRIVCDLMANIKDFPEMVLFSVALVGFFVAFAAASTVGVIAAGVLWGLALAAKTNAIFVAPIAGLFYLLAPLPSGWSRRWRPLAALLVAGGVGIVVLVLLWPYTYDDPPRKLWEHLVFVAFRKQLTRPESIAPPFSQILYTTPIPFLLLFAAGCVPTLRAALRRQPAALLLVLWTAVVLVRLYLPNAVNFDGVRHFLELFPPLSAIAAIGARSCLDLVWKVRARVPRLALASAVLVAPLLSMAASVIRTHPFQIAYWNPLIGGLGGAQARRMAQASDYWGASYRRGLDWVNEHAPPHAALAVPLIEHAVRLVAPVRLRPDIELLPLTSPEQIAVAPERIALLEETARARPVYVMFVLRRDFMNQIMLDCLLRLPPIQAWELDGAPVLLIYRYTPAA